MGLKVLGSNAPFDKDKPAAFADCIGSREKVDAPAAATATAVLVPSHSLSSSACFIVW